MSDGGDEGPTIVEHDPTASATPKRELRPTLTGAIGFLSGVVVTASLVWLVQPAVFGLEQQPVAVEESDADNIEPLVADTTSPAPTEQDPPQYQARPLQSTLETGTESGFPEDLLDEAVELAEMMRESVVQVYGQQGELTSGAGTGWLVQPNIVATNEHVVNQDGWDADLVVRTFSGEEMVVELLGVDVEGDIAFVRLPQSLDHPLFQISTTPVTAGEPVIAVGHPSLIGNWETMAGVVTTLDEYWISDETRKFVDVNTSMPTSPGSSGSAIMRMDGAVIAINSRASYGELGIEGRPPTEEVFVHTFQPRVDNNGGVSADSIIRFAGELGIELELVP